MTFVSGWGEKTQDPIAALATSPIPLVLARELLPSTLLYLQALPSPLATHWLSVPSLVDGDKGEGCAVGSGFCHSHSPPHWDFVKAASL